MHIYAFGSVCRGEIDLGSDIDLLACVDTRSPEIDTEKFSIYQYKRLEEIWREGNPFAWHLHRESKLLFSKDGSDFLRNLGVPAPYSTASSDCDKFKVLFERSYEELCHSSSNHVFNLSCIFLAVRNYATCYSLAIEKPVFSRNSPLIVNPPLNIDDRIFSILSRARILSTRGYGESIAYKEIEAARSAVKIVPSWMELLRAKINHD